MATLKDDRLQIRVGPAEKLLLERAASASHRSVSSFVLQAASSHAEEVLADRQLIQLNPEASMAFGEALMQPAKVNERLAIALNSPKSFTWLD